MFLKQAVSLVVVILFLAGLSQIAQAAQVICENPEYLIDHDGQVSFEQLKTMELPRHEKTRPSFGWNSDTVWVRCSLEKIGSGPVVIEAAYPLLDEVKVYIEKDQLLVQELLVGDSVENEGDIVDRVDPAFRLSGPAGTYRLSFRIVSTSSKQLPLTLYTEEQFVRKETYDLFVQGLYIGILGIMAIYNLFVFASTRHASYLKYSLFVLSMLMFQESISGYTAEYLWPEHKHISDYWINQGGMWATLMAVIFTRSFLHLEQRGRSWFWLSRILISLNVAVLIISFGISYVLSVKLMSLVTFTSILAMLWAAFKLSLQGVREAKFYLLAWTTVIAACAVYIFKQLGWLPINDLTVHSFKIGSVLEVSLLSLALADRLNVLKEEAKDANRKLLEENQKVRMAQKAAQMLAENLQIELRIRHMLVGDLAHRMNNPLNQVSLGAENLESVILGLKRFWEKLLAHQDPHDEEAKTIGSYMQQKFQECRDLFQTIHSSLLTSSHSIKEIRALSGVDGYNLEHVQFGKIMDAAMERLRENFEAEGLARLTIEQRVPEDSRLLTHTVIATMLLELIIGNWLEHIKGPLTLSIAVQAQDERGLEVSVSCQQAQTCPIRSEEAVLEQVTYLAKSYKIFVRAVHEKHEFRLIFPMIDTPL